MENYDLFGDDLASGMLDSLADLGAPDSSFGATGSQPNTSQRQGSSAESLMQSFSNQPPSYTQIGQQGLGQPPSKMSQGYPDYSSPYAQYASAGQPGLGSYGSPPSNQNPSRPMAAYPPSPYHQPSNVPSPSMPSMHYQDYAVQNPGMMRPGSGPPTQSLSSPSRMPGPSLTHLQQPQQPQQFGGYRGPSPSQDLYAQQLQRWNEQQAYGSTVPHYPPSAASAYRQPNAYPSNLPRPPQQQPPPQQVQQQQQQQQQSPQPSGPHSISYMTRTQGPSPVMSQAQYTQGMYPSSTQQYPDYHQGAVSRVPSVPPSTPNYPASHHVPPHQQQQQYPPMSGAQHPQYGSQYGQYYSGQVPGAQGLSSSGPQAPGSNPMAGSPYPGPYGSTPGLPPVVPPSASNGSPGYRPGGYVQLPQSSPRPPTASPRPPAPSPRPSAPSTPTIPMSPAHQQQQSMSQGPGQIPLPQNQGPSSLQALEQMVMPHVNKNSPSPKPHHSAGGVMSPLGGPKTPMSPGMGGPKTPLSPTQWQTPPMNRSSQSSIGKPQQQQQFHPQQQLQQQPLHSPGSMGSIPQSPVNSHNSSLENVLSSNNSRLQESDLDLANLTGTLDTSGGDSNSNHMSTTSQDDNMKPPSPNFQSSDLNSFNSASTPLPDMNSNSNNMNDNSGDSLNNLVSQQQDETRFQQQNQQPNSKSGTSLNESPLNNESESNLGGSTGNMDNNSQSQMSNSSGDSSNIQSSGAMTLSANSQTVSNTLLGPNGSNSANNSNSGFSQQQQQQGMGLNSHGPMSSLSTSASNSPLPSLMNPGLPNMHSQNSPMMGYGPQGSSSGHFGSNGAINSQGGMMTPPMMPGGPGPSTPHQYQQVFPPSAGDMNQQSGPSGQPNFYHAGSGYPPSQFPAGVHPGSMGMRPHGPGQLPMGMVHGGPVPPQMSGGPPDRLQYEIHQIQGQLQHLYSSPPQPQTQMQITELQERLRSLQQQAAQGPYPGMHGPMGPQHGIPPMYGQSMPHQEMPMDMFPTDGPDEFAPGPKGKKKKERKPREPKATGKGKGKGKKEPPNPMMDFGPMIPPPAPAFGTPGPMSHEIYDFQDLPPEMPEKKTKKPRKPRETKSPKEPKKPKEVKPVKEKSPKKSRSKKKAVVDEVPPLGSESSQAPEPFVLDSSAVKTEDNSESDQKNGIGAAGIIAAEGGSTEPTILGASGDGDTSTQDGTPPTTNSTITSTATTAEAVSNEPLPTEDTTAVPPKPSPKKKSKPKMKSSGSSKKRPTRTTIIASLAAKKKKKRNRSDSEGCSDLDATPPPSPPPEEDNTNKRRSGRHSNRKKYIEDGPDILALSDEDLLLPIKFPTTPVKVTEPVEPAAAAAGGSETPLPPATPGSAETSAAVSSAPTPVNIDDNSSTSANNKPNFVFVNPAEEDTMIVQHILVSRMGKRDIVAESSDEEDEPESKPKLEIKEESDPKPLDDDVKIKTELKDEKEESDESKKEKETEESDEVKDSEKKVGLDETDCAKADKDAEESKEAKSADADPETKTEDKGDSPVIKVEKQDETEEEEKEKVEDSEESKAEPVKETKKKRERIIDTVEVEEFYVKYKNFSYLHCEWKTEDELMKGDKRAVAKIKRFKQKQSNRDTFEFLEEDPFNPEYVEVDRILDMSEVRDPATGNITKNYLVKWRSLPYDECTWELADDIDPEKLKHFSRFYKPPPRDQWKPKRRPKAVDWVKIEESPTYNNGNTLRAYQLEGLNWLSFSWYNGRNCILADEMGLGKTIQSLTFVEAVHRYGIRGPFLVIAPLSTVPNWQREFETWTDLNVVVYHGSVASRNMIQEYELFYRHPDNPQMNIKDVYKFNVLITTFEIVLTDVLDLKDFPWRICVIDEAHRLKNKNCKLLEGLRLLNIEHRVLLSGTPLQNNINELFSLLNFLEPTQFTSDDNFKAEFGELTTDTQVQKLQALLKPMMLRRLKEDVEKSIAPKEETIIEVELTNMQKKYYRGILERNFSFLSKGTSSANIPNLMNTMMELRKCCIHPYLLNGAEEEIQRDYKQVYGNSDESDLYYKALISSAGKMVLVDKLLPKLKANGHRVLIFSQMVRCLDILEDYLIYMKYPFERIDGRIRGPLRQAAIDRFSKPDSDRFVFLLCTKAGGLGINLTAADTVIIYDSDWNPQNDLQAQARCHRIGQSKMVKVYRLICRSTYEREMFDRASLKLGLDKAVLQSMNTSQGSSGKGFDTSANKQLSKKEVEDLLKKGAYGALMDEDNAGDKFCEEDIDCILQRRTQVITLETGEKGSTFSKASFASTGIREDINLDDPDFWTKWAKKAEIDMDEVDKRNDLVIHEPRTRTQIKRYGHDEAILEVSEIDTTSDSDEDGNIGERTRGRGKRGKGKQKRTRRNMDEDYHCDDGVVEYGRWSRSECYKIEKGLLTFGWARWPEILAFGQFRLGWNEKAIEDCARMILVHCVNNFRGDEKVRSFVQDLIFPTEAGAERLARNHSGLAHPVSRGGRRSKKKRGEEKLPDPSPEPLVEWIKEEKFDPDVHLDGNYKKHIGKHSNKVLLRIRMLYYIKQEIIGDFATRITSGVPSSEMQICPHTLVVDNGPAPWWDREADASLLIGTYKHGYERYNIMRLDPNLCFLSRFGPPDGSAVMAEISSEVNEEDLDKAAVDEEDEESNSNLDSVSEKLEKPPPSVGSTTNAVELADGKPQWPTITDLNTRIRKLITSYQRNFKKEEIRNVQKLKRLERKEKIDQVVREREKQKLEIYQKKWSKKEEADFFRTISTYGVQYNRKEKRFDWSKFRAISRLDKKFDETLTEYYRAFYAMCKRICGKKLSEEEDLIQVPVEPVAEERARRTLERIDLLNKVREEIIYHPQLEEKLKLCLPSLDMPDWWVPGKHDKDIVLGAARHGLGRTDLFYLNDPDLSFREVLRRHISGEPLTDPPEKSKKFDKKSKWDDDKRGKGVDIEIKDIKQERADAAALRLKEAAADATVQRAKEAADAAEKEKDVQKSNESSETAENLVKDENSKSNVLVKEEPENLKTDADTVVKEPDPMEVDTKDSESKSPSKETEVVIKKEPEDKDAEEDSKSEAKTKESEAKDEAVEKEKSEKSKEPEKSEAENENTKDDVTQVKPKEEAEEEEPRRKRRRVDTDDMSTSKSPTDYSTKGKKDDEESTKSGNSEMNEVRVEIKDEFKITIKLPAEKMKRVEVQVKGSPKFSVPEPPAPATITPQTLTPEDLLSYSTSILNKSLLNSDSVSGENLEAIGSLMNQLNPIRWPRDRAIQLRLEHIVHLVEKGEWPVSRFFTSAGVSDLFEYTTPQGTPDTATPVRDTPTPISECSDLAPPEDLIMTLPPAPTVTTTTPSRRGRRKRIAIDVETERAKLQALLNHSLQNANIMPQMPRLSNLRGGPSEKEDSSEGETPSRIQQSKFQPPPAHQHYATISSSLLRTSHQPKQPLQSPQHTQQQAQQHRQSPSSRYSPQQAPQNSSLDLSFKSVDRNIAAAAISALSSLSSVTVTPVTLQSPSSNTNMSHNNNSTPMDLSAPRVSKSRQRERERDTPTPTMRIERIRTPEPEMHMERPKQSKLENMLDKLRKRKLGDTEPSMPMPVEKDKRRKKLDDIVFGLGLSASKVQPPNPNPSMFSPPPRGSRGGNFGASSSGNSSQANKLSSPPMSAHQQHFKDMQTSQASLFSNPLLSATLSLFNSAAGKEFSRQLAGQTTASLNKSKDPNPRISLPGPSGLTEMPKCDLSRLAELAVPKFDLFSQDAKVNKWLAEHANLTPERPVSPELLDGRRRRRPRVDPMLLDWNKLNGDENVTVINRMTGKKVTGPKAPQLKLLGQWLVENPAYDVDPRWADLVREKGNLVSELHRRLPGGEKKKGPGRPAASPPVSIPTSSSATSVPTSSANAYSSLGLGAFSGLQGLQGLSGLNPNLLASLPFGSLDPKNPLFMPFGGLGSLGGLGNLGNLGNLGSLSGLSSLGLTNSLFGFGLPGMDMGGGDGKGGKDQGHSSSGGAGTGHSSSNKKEDKAKKSSLAQQQQQQQNMLSSALPFLFPNPGLMYNPLGLGSFPLGGMNPPFGSLGQSNLVNGMGANLSTGAERGKKSSTVTSKGGPSLGGLGGLAGLNIPSFSKKDGSHGGGSQRAKSPATATVQQGLSPVQVPVPQQPHHPPQPNPEDSDDESMKSLMGNHADDLPDDDSPNDNAERIVLKESKELEKEMAQQRMETRRERRVKDRTSSLLSESHRGGLTAAERQLLMVKKKERLAKEDYQPMREAGRTTRRSAAAASRSRLEEAVYKMKGGPSESQGSSEGPSSK